MIIARLRWWPWMDLSWLPDGLPWVQNKSPIQIRNSTGLSTTSLYPWNMFTNREYHPALNCIMTLYLRDDCYPHMRCWTPHVTVHTGLWQYRWTPRDCTYRTVTVPLDTTCDCTYQTGLWQYCWTPHDCTYQTGLWQYRWTLHVRVHTRLGCDSTTGHYMWWYIPDRTVTVPTNEINIFMLHYTKCYFWDKGRLVFGDIPIKYVNVV
jgi:hypothetical protein